MKQSSVKTKLRSIFRDVSAQSLKVDQFKEEKEKACGRNREPLAGGGSKMSHPAMLLSGTIHALILSNGSKHGNSKKTIQSIFVAGRN